METILDQKRAALGKEIEIAEYLLIKNSRHLNIAKYISPSSDFVSDAISKVLANPQKSLESLDLVTQTVLPESNFLRNGLKYINLLWNLFNQFSPSSQTSTSLSLEKGMIS